MTSDSRKSNQTSRRTFVKGAAAASTLLAMPGVFASGAAAATNRADVVIIGSGYAGSVAALRLSEAGMQSVVLERGRRWPINPAGDTFATGDNIDGRAVWLDTSLPVFDGRVDRFTGVLEAVAGIGIICLAGAGVGGGSLVNNAVMMMPRRDHFDLSFRGALDYDDMSATWYPRARQLVGPTPIPDDVLASAAYANARQAQDEMSRAGLDIVRPDLAVDWDIVRNEIAGTAEPSLIRGQSLFGVNSGAKRSVDRTILATAEQSGLVDVRPLHQVTTIESTSTGYRVSYEELADDGSIVREDRIDATSVVLAAGSLGSVKLLLNARASGSIPGLGPEIGRRWGTDGDSIVLFSGTPNPNPAVGGPSHIVGQAWDTGDPPVTMLNFPLGVPAVDALLRESLATAPVPAVGRVARFSNDFSVPVWPVWNAGVRAVRNSVRSIADDISDGTPGRDVKLATSLITSHPLGGAALGYATDDVGQLNGSPGLFVMDSSLIPGSTGAVPPALTVTALADRCITNALDRNAIGASAASASGGRGR